MSKKRMSKMADPRSVAARRDRLLWRLWLAPELPQRLTFHQAQALLGRGPSQTDRLLSDWVERRELEKAADGKYQIGDRFRAVQARRAEQIERLNRLAGE